MIYDIEPASGTYQCVRSLRGSETQREAHASGLLNPFSQSLSFRQKVPEWGGFGGKICSLVVTEAILGMRPPSADPGFN